MGKLVVENGRATSIYAVLEHRTGGFSRRFYLNIVPAGLAADFNRVFRRLSGRAKLIEVIFVVTG